MGGINYRQDGIGYEYNDTNNSFETEYLQTLSKNSSVESITHALSPSESNTSFHSSNDRKLPEPLASVMDDIENGTLSEHDPPNISPSKEEVEAYLANIPGMKMFSPRAPRDPRAELPVNAKPVFAARTITDSRIKKRLEKSLPATNKQLAPKRSVESRRK